MHYKSLEAALNALSTDPTITSVAISLKHFGINEVQALALKLEANTTLTSLHLPANEISDQGAIALASALKNNTTLTCLELTHNRIGYEGAHAFVSLLETNKTLTTLNLDDNKCDTSITDEINKLLHRNKLYPYGIESLLKTRFENMRKPESLEDTKNLRTTLEKAKQDLLLNSFPKNELIYQKICTAIIILKTYTYIDFNWEKKAVAELLTIKSSDPYYDMALNALLDVLTTDKPLTLLDLGSETIDNELIKDIAYLFQKIKSLTSIKICWRDIHDEVSKTVALMLREIKTLTSIHLNDNTINAQMAKNLPSLLLTNTNITEIDLSFARFGDEGAKAFASMLLENTTLTSLNLFGTDIRADGANAIISMLQKNTTLRSLDLGGNHLGFNVAIEVASMLERNTTLTSLSLHMNEISDAGAKAIIAVLPKNTSLRSLDLGSNYLGLNTAIDAASALKINENLTSLDFWSRHIGDEGAQAFASALLINKTLTSLNITEEGIDDNIMNDIKDLLASNQRNQELMEAALLNGFESVTQPKSLNDIYNLLAPLVAAKDSLDKERYPKALIGYQKINIAITILKAFADITRDKNAAAIDKLASIKKGQPYYDIAQNGLVELACAQRADIRRKMSENDRSAIVENTLRHVADENPHKFLLLHGMFVFKYPAILNVKTVSSTLCYRWNLNQSTGDSSAKHSPNLGHSKK